MYHSTRRLGQDDFETWPTELYPWNAEMAVDIYSAPQISVSPQWPTAQPTPSTDSWWSKITGALVPVSQAAANIIRATSGQPSGAAPTYTRNAAGQMVPIGSSGFDFQSLLIPAAIGIGAIMLIRSSGGKRRR